MWSVDTYNEKLRIRNTDTIINKYIIQIIDPPLILTYTLIECF